MRTSGRARPELFRVFRFRSFRFQWPGDLLVSWAMEMEVLILGWFVLVATDSPLLLATLAALHYGGTLISPYFGVIADRVERRSMLIVMRLIYAGLAAVVMALGLTGSVEPWQLFIISAVSGLVKPSDLLVRNSLIADTVPLAELRNAMGVARTTMDSARIIGALVGAGLLSALGIGAAYGAVVGLYLASVLLSFGITVRRNRPPSSDNPWAELKLGFSYVRNNASLLPTMCLAFLANLTAIPVSHGLLPVLARDIYFVDENGLARLVASFAVGALLGSLMMATTLGGSRPGRTMIIYLLSWHVLIVILAQVTTALAGMLLLVLIGAAQSYAMISMSVLLLGTAEEAFRGRVSGVRMLAVYGLPVGLILGGTLIELIGVLATFAVFGMVGVVLILAVTVLWPEIWKS
jgi:predicted MFS family arabinose efflux permease